MFNPRADLCENLFSLAHEVVDSGEERVPYGLRDVVDALLQSLELLRLSLIDRRGHLQCDARAGAERVVHTDDVVLKVSDLVIHEVDKGDGLCVAEGFLQLHLLGGVHRFAELPAQLVQDFRHTEELIVGVRKAEAQGFAALRCRSQERLVLGARLAAAHCGLQHTQNRELLFEGDVCGRCRRAQCLDTLSHAGAGCLELLDALRDTSREHLTELKV